MGKIIAISNHKGGVGKTTSALNIGAGLSKLKKKVLLIDLDPQANLTQSLGIKEPENNIYGVIKNIYAPELIKINKNLFLIPSVSELSGAELELSAEAGREFLLKEVIEPLSSNYDFIVIDCPPSLGLLTINAFTASDFILIPMQAEYLALQGIGKLLGLMDKIKKRLNPRLDIGGIFITQFDKRKVLNRYVCDTIEEHFKGKVFKTKIRNNIALAEAPNEGTDIFTYQPDSNGADDYLRLSKEIAQRFE